MYYLSPSIERYYELSKSLSCQVVITHLSQVIECISAQTPHSHEVSKHEHTTLLSSLGPRRGRKSTRPGANGVVTLSPSEFLDQPRRFNSRLGGLAKRLGFGNGGLPACI